MQYFFSVIGVLLLYGSSPGNDGASLDFDKKDRILGQNIHWKLIDQLAMNESEVDNGNSIFLSSNDQKNIAGPKEIPWFGKVFFQDLKDIIQTPLAWEKSEWTQFGLWSLSVPLISRIDDQAVSFVNEHKTPVSGRVGGEIGKFGQEYSFALIAGFYLTEKVWGYRKGGKIARDGLMASLIAGGMISPLLKTAVGRSRPKENFGSNSFQAFSGNHSFPSGHTTQAFAVASVVAAHYDNIWVKASSYSLAGLVGISRMESNSHFSSDVLAGALIGSLMGRKIVHLNEDRRSKYTIEPYYSELGAGVSLKFRQNKK